MSQQSTIRTSICLFVLWAFSLQAAGEMLISPTRGFLSEEVRSTSLVLRNTASGARTYRLSWEDKRMTESGQYVAVESGEDWPSAAKMVRFSPRQITVGPGENQTVRLSYRPPSDLPAGEYRSHLRLQVLADVSEPTDIVEMEHPDEDGISFRLAMQMSFSVPVIVRHEVPTPEVTISGVTVAPAEQGKNMALQVALTKEGNVSSFGRLVVEMQAGASSPVEMIGRRRDLTIFHEISQRTVRVPLRDTQIPPGSWVRVAYEGQGEYEGVLWDEQVFKTE